MFKTFITTLAIFAFITTRILAGNYVNSPQGSIYNRVIQEDDFQGFAGIILHNRDAGLNLLEKEITLFIPKNDAFRNYGKPLHSDLALYHMATEAKSLDSLKTVQNISSIYKGFPKLWITRTKDDDIFVNNAQIIEYKSNYRGKTKNDIHGRDQILHVIDEVLDPIVRHPKFPHTAYDFMDKTERWRLDANKSVANFFYKVREQKLKHLYQIEGANTYFIPVDSGIDHHKFNMLNKAAIFGHIVPYYVLFTKPTTRRLNYETMANYDDIYMVLSMEDIDGKLYVKSDTIMGNTENPKGEVIAEIIEPNIPVFNGVVHLISQPLGVFSNALKPFPYLSIMDKLATDIELSTTYEMGEESGFNEIFTTHDVKFTYFVVNNYGWRQIKKKGLSFSGSNANLLKRHLIISETAYTMENLMASTGGRNYTHVELKTVGGFLRLMVLKIGDDFYIKWARTYIKVVRPNYECQDGLIHILAGPIYNLF